MTDAPTAGAAPAHDSHRAVRQDGEASRARLLRSGLQLFAQQGFSKTSTRELAEHAGVNIASISYYFGDKAGLYRAVFFEPLGSPHEDIARYADPGLSLPQALAGFYASLLEPLKQGDTARLCMKLHFREMLEPTGLWQEEVTHSIRPMHDALVTVLCRQFELAQPDDELHRLALCISALGVHVHIGHDVIEEVAPQLQGGSGALDRWTDRLVMYALAMIDAERRRREEKQP